MKEFAGLSLSKIGDLGVPVLKLEAEETGGSHAYELARFAGFLGS